MNCTNIGSLIVTIAIQMHGKVIDLNLSPETQNTFNNVRLYSHAGDFKDVISTPVDDYNILPQLDELFQKDLNKSSINVINEYIGYSQPKYKSFLKSRVSDEYNEEDREKVCRLIHNIFFDKSLSTTTSNDNSFISCLFEKFNYEFTKSCDFAVLNNSMFININKDINRNNFSLKKKFNIEKNKKILLYSGIIHPWRGIDLLFELAKILNNKNFVIVIIGFGSHYNFYKSKIFEAKIDNIIIHEALPYSELAYWFQDAYLGTMLFQNIDLNHQLCSPNKLWEYASASVPFVSFNEFTEIKKFDEKYNIGFFVNSNDSAKKISSFIENIKVGQLKEKKNNLKFFVNSTDYKIQFNKIVAIINNHHV